MKRPNYVERIEVRLREKLVVQINGQPYCFGVAEVAPDDLGVIRVTLVAYPAGKRRVRER